MQIWVDADACPKSIKEILYRAAKRVGVTVVLVANKLLRPPPSKFIRAIVVPAGFDGSDRRIVQLLQKGDLVVTADIPLAAQVIANGGHALNPRGELYTDETIHERLSMRNFMSELRETGVDVGGPSSLHRGDIQAFANQLDRLLTSTARNVTKKL